MKLQLIDEFALDYEFKEILGSDWQSMLEEPLLKTEYMKNLMLFLEESYKQGNLNPKKKDVFKTFRNIKFSNVKVVILGSEPYRDFRSMGIPLGNYEKFGVNYSPELISWNRGIEREFYDGLRMYNEPSLATLGAQGVLLLDSALTSTDKKAFDHSIYWKTFIREVLKVICEWHPATIFVFLGKEAQEFVPVIGKTGYKFLWEHPTEAIAAKKNWDASVLREVNSILNYLNGKTEEIYW